MRKWWWALASVAFFIPRAAKADQRVISPAPITLVAVSTFTPSGSANHMDLEFTNAVSNYNIRIVGIQISVSSANASGALFQFGVFSSTDATAAVVGASSVAVTSQNYFLGYSNSLLYAPLSNMPAPSTYISFSTAPVTSSQGGQIANTTAPTLEGSEPIMRPLIVNTLNTATANFNDSYTPNSPADIADLILPANQRRGIVFEEEPLGGAAAPPSKGVVLIRILYTVQ